jgi:hypothetical protein
VPDRRLPVHPNLNQLRQQAKDLLYQVRRGDPVAIGEFKKHHVEDIAPRSAKLADAQLVLARSYEARSWPRLVLACQLIDAISSDDVEAIRKLVLKRPHLLNEEALIRKNSNWGPPMTYAANLGRDRIIEILQKLSATDLKSALGRATLQSKIDTARKLHAMLGAPPALAGDLDGPAYTLSVPGTALLFEFGDQIRDAEGKPLAPVDVVLETDSRNPTAKHQILEMYAQNGLELDEPSRRTAGGAPHTVVAGPWR